MTDFNAQRVGVKFYFKLGKIVMIKLKLWVTLNPMSGLNISEIVEYPLKITNVLSALQLASLMLLLPKFVKRFIDC